LPCHPHPAAIRVDLPIRNAGGSGTRRLVAMEPHGLEPPTDAFVSLIYLARSARQARRSRTRCRSRPTGRSEYVFGQPRLGESPPANPTMMPKRADSRRASLCFARGAVVFAHPADHAGAESVGEAAVLAFAESILTGSAISTLAIVLWCDGAARMVPPR
jgi:hypothetical protein